MTPTLKSFFTALLILAFSTGASDLGFVPIRRSKSQSSIPLIRELKR